MAQQNFVKLAQQGRAFDATRAWTEDELTALITLEKGAGKVDEKTGFREGIDRLVAAEYVRNGILTVEDYDKAIAAGYEVKSLDTVRADAVKEHQAQVRKDLGLEEPADEEDSNDDESEEEDDSDKKEPSTDADDSKNEDDEKEEGEGSPAPLTRPELEAKATALGINFTPVWKDETLAKKIAEAEATAANKN